MQYSTNFNMNKPELNEQYRLSHWNENTDIIDNAMQAIRSGTDDVMKETLLNFCYPIGSIYWSGVATNPHDLFGGTWQQIKDCFVWAKGDSDTLDATGGEKTHTLTTTEMPSHTHTFTGSAVTSGVNSRGHTHSVTASGSISGGAYKFTGTQAALKATAGGTVSISDPGHAHPYGTGNAGGTEMSSGNYLQVGGNHRQTTANLTSTTTSKTTGITATFTGTEHSHTYTPAGSISITTNPTFTGSAVTSGGESQNHTHSVTASGTNSSTGGDQAHNNMPPYIVKYCWERTA